MGYIQSMPRQKGNLTEFVTLDARGYQLGFHEDLQPPFYQAVPNPECNIQKSQAFGTQCDASQEAANNQNLILSVIYMAQSAVGRAAIDMLSGKGNAAGPIRIGYNETFQSDGTPQAGYRDGIPYILVDPKTPPALQHLILIQQAAQFAAVLRTTACPVAALPEAAELIGQNSRFAGLIALFDHSVECFANRLRNPQRFVPPDLELWMAKISSSPAVQTLYKQNVPVNASLQETLALEAPRPAPEKPPFS